MQLYSRIVVNLLVISVTILVNLLVKLTKLRFRGGGHGGAYPLYASLSQTVLPPRGTKAQAYIQLFRGSSI